MSDADLITASQVINNILTVVYFCLGLWVLSHLRLTKGMSFWVKLTIVWVGVSIMAFGVLNIIL